LILGEVSNAKREAGFGGARQNRQAVGGFTDSGADFSHRVDEHPLEHVRSSLNFTGSELEDKLVMHASGARGEAIEEEVFYGYCIAVSERKALLFGRKLSVLRRPQTGD
jgi:hypothetical protein